MLLQLSGGQYQFVQIRDPQAVNPPLMLDFDLTLLSKQILAFDPYNAA
jgi:hypothetical protein